MSLLADSNPCPNMSGKPLFADDRSFPSKFKIRRITCVRDFPENCGDIDSETVVADEMCPDPNNFIDSAVCRSAIDASDFSPPSYIKRQWAYHVRDSPHQSNVKRRRVHIVRDFPEHCGRCYCYGVGGGVVEWSSNVDELMPSEGADQYVAAEPDLPPCEPEISLALHDGKDHGGEARKIVKDDEKSNERCKRSGEKSSRKILVVRKIVKYARSYGFLRRWRMMNFVTSLGYPKTEM